MRRSVSSRVLDCRLLPTLVYILSANPHLATIGQIGPQRPAGALDQRGRPGDRHEAAVSSPKPTLRQILITYLHDYRGPVGIMIDGRDDVVPAKFGVNLYEGYGGPKRLWTFPDGGHISIMESPSKFWGEVLEFWRTNQGNLN